ncbi:hypothetical protein HanPI659440_Chr02g0034091 [Helianthus annuus]|nr:hypothetical protein HanPI659440_Chr02g0034091 [Helianthus annuus]
MVLNEMMFDRTSRLVNITHRIMRYYASTLNRFYNSFVVWSATRSSMLFDRVTSS